MVSRGGDIPMVDAMLGQPAVKFIVLIDKDVALATHYYNVEFVRFECRDKAHDSVAAPSGGIGSVGAETLCHFPSFVKLSRGYVHTPAHRPGFAPDVAVTDRFILQYL